MPTNTIFQSPQVGIYDIINAQREGMIQAVIEITKEKAKNAQRINAMLSKSKTIPLYQLSTFWPLKFFPVRVVVNSDRVNISFWSFFNSGQIVSLTTDIIQEISLESGPLFSKIKITTNKAMEEVVQVDYLKKEHAIRARRIIQGLITANKNDINLEGIHPEDLREKLERLGKSQEAEADIA